MSKLQVELQRLLSSFYQTARSCSRTGDNTYTSASPLGGKAETYYLELVKILDLNSNYKCFGVHRDANVELEGIDDAFLEKVIS